MKLFQQTPTYLCAWDENTFIINECGPIAKKKLSFFTEGLGYEQDDINRIALLQVGQFYALDGHVVVRIK